jgi:hypothetical protein
MPVALRRVLAAAAAALVVLGLVSAAAAPAGAAPDPPASYRPPVDAEVTDPFRPPTHPYGPGHRGLEYGSAPGAAVHATADGKVVFAGLVAGTRHVTVLHPDGLRTTVSYLRSIAVVVGQEVARGQVLGTADGPLLLTARQGDRYLDPASLFADGPPRVWLVPFDEPPGAGPAGERRAIRQLLGAGRAVARGVAGGIDAAVGAADAVVGATVAPTVEWAGAHGGELLRTAATYAPLAVPQLRAALLVAGSLQVLQDAWEASHRPCTPAGAPAPPPAERRIAVLVAGLGSTSGSGSVDRVDVGALGYDPADVVRLSYRGGRTPQSTGHPRGVPVHRYSKADSQGDLRVAGRHLADLVEDLARSAPGVPIDVIAHSQGGVVARLGLAELDRRGTAGPVAHLATLGTPHRGAIVATHARTVGAVPVVGDWALGLFGPSLHLDPAAPTAEQLSTAGDLVHELERTPLPPGVDAVSIAARTDPVVPVPQTRLDGARSVVIPLTTKDAHTDLPGDPRTTRELALALTGAPPTCRGFAESLLDHAAGQAIDRLEGSFGSP